MFPFATVYLDSHLSLILRDYTYRFYEIYKYMEEDDTLILVNTFNIPNNISEDILYAQQIDYHQSGQMSILLTTESKIYIITPDLFKDNSLSIKRVTNDVKEISFPQSINTPLILHNYFNENDIQLLLNLGDKLVMCECQNGDCIDFEDMIQKQSIDMIKKLYGDSFKFKLSHYHNSHIIDVNNDCLNEIILELKDDEGLSLIVILEYNYSLQKFDIIYTNKLGLIKDLHLLDLNADGLIDIFYSEYNNSDNLWYSSILYAQSKNYNIMTTSCKHLLQLDYILEQTPFRNYLYNLTATNANPKATLDNLNNDIYNSNKKTINEIVLNYDLIYNPDIKSMFHHSNIQFGDFNADGYIDILATFYNKVDDRNESYILINEIHPDYSRDLRATFREYFSSLNEHNYDVKQKHTNLTQRQTIKDGYLVFYDLNHDGILDIIQYRQNEENERQGLIQCYINKTIHNPTFITIKMFQMNTKDNDDDDIEMRFISQLTNQTGIIRFKYLPDFYDSNYYEYQVKNVCANSGLGGRFCAMQLYSGLGNTNGLVIDFTYAVSKFPEPLQKVWSPVIPNSKFLVTNNNKEVWLSLDLNESLVLTRLCIIIGSILVIMLMTLFIAHIYEVDRDNKDNKKTLKLFKNKRFR